MPKKNINTQNKHIRECNWNNKKTYFYEESNDWIKNICHRARFFVLVTFLKNPEKNKDYNKCCLPFQPIVFVYLRSMYITGRRHSYYWLSTDSWA